MNEAIANQSHKTSETLLGIETREIFAGRATIHASHKTSETLLGIETWAWEAAPMTHAKKATKPLKPF